MAHSVVDLKKAMHYLRGRNQDQAVFVHGFNAVQVVPVHHEKLDEMLESMSEQYLGLYNGDIAYGAFRDDVEYIASSVLGCSKTLSDVAGRFRASVDGTGLSASNGGGGRCDSF